MPRIGSVQEPSVKIKRGASRLPMDSAGINDCQYPHHQCITINRGRLLDGGEKRNIGLSAQ